MQIGDLVTDGYGSVGIITAQIGAVDRWWVEWIDGESYALNGCSLWLVS